MSRASLSCPLRPPESLGRGGARHFLEEEAAGRVLELEISGTSRGHPSPARTLITFSDIAVAQTAARLHLHANYHSHAASPVPIPSDSPQMPQVLFSFASQRRPQVEVQENSYMYFLVVSFAENILSMRSSNKIQSDVSDCITHFLFTRHLDV